MRIGIWIGNDAHDVDVGTADLTGDAAPEVLGGGDLDDAATGGGGENTRPEHQRRSCDAPRKGERDAAWRPAASWPLRSDSAAVRIHEQERIRE